MSLSRVFLETSTSFKTFILYDGVIAGENPGCAPVPLHSRTASFSTSPVTKLRWPRRAFQCRTFLLTFEECAWVPNGNVNLLGATISTQCWCATLSKKRVESPHSTRRHWPLPRHVCALIVGPECSVLALPIRGPDTNPPRHLSFTMHCRVQLGVANGGNGARNACEHELSLIL